MTVTLAVTAATFAQAGAGELGDWVSRLGFPVMVVLAAMLGKIRFEPEVAGLRDTIAAGTNRELRLEAQVDAFSDQYETVVLPTVHEALAVVRQSAASIQASTETATHQVEALARLEAGVRAIEVSLHVLATERPPR